MTRRRWTVEQKKEQSYKMKGNRYGLLGGRPPTEPIVRFLVKVKKTKTCWIWLGKLTKGGYGQFSSRISGVHSAHQFSYTYFKGPIPARKHVLHKCDNAACVKPAHLEIGTPLKNNRDMWKRGRGVSCPGAANGMFGKRPWNKNRSWSAKVRAKISKSRQGIPAWNKGIHVRQGWPPKEKNAS